MELYTKEKKYFVQDGFVSFPGFFPSSQCKSLLDEILSQRNFNDIFMSKNDFELNKQMTGTNPRAGRNLAEKLDTEFIFGSKKFIELMKTVLGDRFRVLDYKFVAGIPKSKLPEWVKEIISDRLINNLGPYIKPEMRDITYFHGIDYHQDIIDFQHRELDFITVYVYLDKVSLKHAPLHILPKSHSLGCSSFPHNIRKIECKFLYTNDSGETIECDDKTLIGDSGDMSFWHSAILHGTQPQIEDESRVSLRILLERNGPKNMSSWLDNCNSKIKGLTRIDKTRRDLDSNYEPILKGNIINRLA